MLEASRRPHAPAYLESLATRLLAQGDKIETAIATTRVALAEAVEDRTRTELQTRLNALLLQQALEQLDRQLDQRRAAGLPTRTEQDLLDAVAPVGLPEDPFGGRFSIDPATGKARSTNEDKLLRVHIHPGALPVEKSSTEARARFAKSSASPPRSSMAAIDIALFTVKDLVRRRILVVLALFGVGMILLSFPLRELTIGQWQRLITDIGLGGTELTLTLIAVFVGSTLISGDLERRTLYPLLSKPISRAAFVSGKFLGLSMVMVLLAFLMGLGVELMLLFAKQEGQLLINSEALATVALTAVLTGAIAVFFSSFTTSTLAATFSLAFALLGHFVDNLVYFATKSETAFGAGLARVERCLPNFELTNLKDFAAHDQAITALAFASRLAYGTCYALLIVSLGAIIFTRRDLGRRASAPTGGQGEGAQPDFVRGPGGPTGRS